MNVLESFAAELTSRLAAAEIPTDLRSEGDLERRVLLPVARDLVAVFPKVHVYAHPWKEAERCSPDCESGRGLIEGRTLHGCPRCWEKSKKWGAVKFCGTHCFDFVVGEPKNSLAVDVKLFRRPKKGGRKANGELQRLIGQCTLARMVHRNIVGFVVVDPGALDALDRSSDIDSLLPEGITLIVRTVGVSEANIVGSARTW